MLLWTLAGMVLASAPHPMGALETHRQFARAAVKAVRDSRYRPATIRGQPVAVPVCQPLHFSLRVN